MHKTIDVSKLEMVTGGAQNDVCFTPFGWYSPGCYQGLGGNVSINQDIHPHAPGENISVGGSAKQRKR